MSSVNISHVSSPSQSAWRHHQQRIQTSLERLSSGQRINQAADDAAGLAISTRYQSQLRGISAAVRNSQDAFSLMQTGDGAIGEMQSSIYRLRELTIQAMSATMSTQDLETIQGELDSLVTALQQIVDQTDFNQKKLFDGQFKSERFHLGSSVEESVFVSLENLNTSYLGRRTVVESSSGVDTSERLINGDVFTINSVTIRESQASDDLVSSVDNETSAIAKAAAINAVSAETGVIAYATETRTDAQATLNAYVGEQIYGATNAVQSVDLTGSTYIEINGVKVGGFTVQDFDSDQELVKAINEITSETGVYAELNGDGELVLIAPDGRNIALDYYGDANGITLESLIGLKSGNEVADNAAQNGYAYGGGIRLESLYTVEVNFGAEVNTVVGDLVGDYTYSDVALFAANEDSSLSQLSLSSREGRDQALKSIDTALEQLSSQRAFLGGLQSRLESNLNTLQQRYNDISATSSRIADADFAEETSQLTLHQIKRDALIAVMQRRPELDQQMLSLLTRVLG